MIHSFEGDALIVPADRPKQVTGHVRVDGIEGRLLGARVRLDVQHTDPTDLRVLLRDPAGHEALLVNRSSRPGGVYTAPKSVAGTSADGHWTLVVQDLVTGDGGRVTWGLDLETTAGAFFVELDLDETLRSTLAYRAAFEHAAARVAEVVVGALTPATLPGGRTVDNVLVFGRASDIDGPGKTLGQAGPTHIRDEGLFPIAANMHFDVADLAAMADDGSLVDVVVHEIFHAALGFGTLWRLWGLLRGAGTADPLFIGEQARAEYARWSGKDAAADVPVENQGGAGTRESHWRESVFHAELMTGWIDQGFNPLSRLTVASLADAGYVVDMQAADLLSPSLRALGAAPGRVRTCGCSRVEPVRVAA